MIKKKGLTAVVTLDDGQEKSLAYASIKKYVPPSEPSPKTDEGKHIYVCPSEPGRQGHQSPQRHDS